MPFKIKNWKKNITNAQKKVPLRAPMRSIESKNTCSLLLFNPLAFFVRKNCFASVVGGSYN